MIAKLRIRMTILVCAVLILVSAGIVFSVNFLNWRNITARAEDALEALSVNNGMRPGFRKAAGSRDAGIPEDMDLSTESPDPEAAPFEDVPDRRGPADTGRHRPGEGQPPLPDEALADLGNYYVVTLDDDGNIKEWASDRSELYSDEQISDITAIALSSGKNSGRIGTQFFRFTAGEQQRQLIVLDERLEILSARGVLRTVAIIASAACFLLCAAAYFLIRAMVRPVQEAFERQKQFVWDAGHELKTPLAVIGANAQVLRGEIGDNEYLGYIHSEVRRTDDLIRNLLTLARMDQGTVQAVLKPADLGKTVLTAALPFESTAFETGKHLALDVEENVFCRIDEAMIRQLTVILLSNAFKYSDDGGRIRVSVHEKGKNGELTVANTGQGIVPEDLERIFDRFYRADSSHNRETEGYGLGLSIAKNIADAHKGKIRVKSVPGEETVFTVILPG